MTAIASAVRFVTLFLTWQTSAVALQSIGKTIRANDGLLSDYTCCKGSREELPESTWPKGMDPAMYADGAHDKVRIEENVSYRQGGEDGSWNVDVYTPSGDAPVEGWPAMIVIHDGAWKVGDKGGYKLVCEDFAAVGFVTVAANYRLSPMNPFPAPVEDVKNVVRYMRANSQKLKLDPTRIGAFGISSGAHLAAMLALTQNSDGLEGDGPHLSESSFVQAVAGISTPADLEHLPAPEDPKLPCCQDFLHGEIETLPQRTRLASPLNYVSAESTKPPPFLLIHAIDDSIVAFRGQSESLADAICKKGSSVTMLTFSGGHGADLFAHHKATFLGYIGRFFQMTLQATFRNDAAEKCFAL